MLNIYLLRHGETAWNAAGNKYCGRTDILLTEKGIAQAENVRMPLKDLAISKVYSSPLQRALETARITSGQKNIITDERLIEIDFGKWEGKTRKEFIREDSTLWNHWEKDPITVHAGGTGESAHQITQRLDSFYSSLTSTENKNIMVVGHNGVNRFYLAYKLGMDLKNYRRIIQENSSITLFSLGENGDFTLNLLNSRGV